MRNLPEPLRAVAPGRMSRVTVSAVTRTLQLSSTELSRYSASSIGRVRQKIEVQP